MRRRCYGTYYTEYKNYGGRGITICEEWDEYPNFKKWALSNGYDDSKSIDRIDVNGNYCPENCRWATKIEQANNTTRNRIVEYKGRKQTVMKWCRELGLPEKRTRTRLDRGWKPEDVFEAKKFARPYGRRGTGKRPVKQFDLNANYIQTFDSITEAAKSVNGRSTNIGHVCMGKRHKAYGYYWEYA